MTLLLQVTCSYFKVIVKLASRINEILNKIRYIFDTMNWSMYHSPIWHNIAFRITTTNVELWWASERTPVTPYLTFRGEIWNVYCEKNNLQILRVHWNTPCLPVFHQQNTKPSTPEHQCSIQHVPNSCNQLLRDKTENIPPVVKSHTGKKCRQNFHYSFTTNHMDNLWSLDCKWM